MPTRVTLILNPLRLAVFTLLLVTQSVLAQVEYAYATLQTIEPPRQAIQIYAVAEQSAVVLAAGAVPHFYRFDLDGQTLNATARLPFLSNSPRQDFRVQDYGQNLIWIQKQIFDAISPPFAPINNAIVLTHSGQILARNPIFPGTGEGLVGTDEGLFSVTSFARLLQLPGNIQLTVAGCTTTPCVFMQTAPVPASQSGAWFVGSTQGTTLTQSACELIRIDRAGMVLERVTIQQQCFATGTSPTARLQRDAQGLLRMSVVNALNFTESMLGLTFDDRGPLTLLSGVRIAPVSPGYGRQALAPIAGGDWIAAKIRNDVFTLARYPSSPATIAVPPLVGTPIWSRDSEVPIRTFSRLVVAPNGSSMLQLDSTSPSVNPFYIWHTAQGEFVPHSDNWRSAAFDALGNVIASVRISPNAVDERIEWFAQNGQLLSKQAYGPISLTAVGGTAFISTTGSADFYFSYFNGDQSTNRRFNASGLELTPQSVNGWPLSRGAYASDLRYFDTFQADPTTGATLSEFRRSNVETGETKSWPNPCDNECYSRITFETSSDEVLLYAGNETRAFWVHLSASGMQSVAALPNLQLSQARTTPTRPAGDLLRYAVVRPDQDGHPTELIDIYGVDTRLDTHLRYTVTAAGVELEPGGGVYAASADASIRERYDAYGALDPSWRGCQVIPFVNVMTTVTAAAVYQIDGSNADGYELCVASIAGPPRRVWLARNLLSNAGFSLTPMVDGRVRLQEFGGETYVISTSANDMLQSSMLQRETYRIEGIPTIIGNRAAFFGVGADLTTPTGPTPGRFLIAAPLSEPVLLMASGLASGFE